LAKAALILRLAARSAGGAWTGKVRVEFCRPRLRGGIICVRKVGVDPFVDGLLELFGLAHVVVHERHFLLLCVRHELFLEESRDAWDVAESFSADLGVFRDRVLLWHFVARVEVLSALNLLILFLGNHLFDRWFECCFRVVLFFVFLSFAHFFNTLLRLVSVFHRLLVESQWVFGSFFFIDGSNVEAFGERKVGLESPARIQLFLLTLELLYVL